MDDHVGITTQNSFNITTVSNQVLLNNANRKYLFIQNQGNQPIYLQFGTVQSGNTGIQINGNNSYESLKPMCQSVYLIAAGGTQTVWVLEG